MAKIQAFERGERFSDPSFSSKLQALVAEANKRMGLRGDPYIAANHGPNGWALHLNLELLRQRIGRGVIMYGKGQQYTDEADGVAWKETATAGIAEVSVKRCDDDGSNAHGDAFTVYCYHSTAVDPNIRVDMVVPYLIAVSGRLETLHDFGDGKIGEIKMWAVGSSGPENIPAGWAEYTNLKAKFPVGYDSEDEDFNTYKGSADVRGHSHSITECLPTAVQAAYQYEQEIATDTQKHIPPYFALTFIERIN